MTVTRNPIEIFGVPIIQSAFCFTYVEFLTAPTTSLMQKDPYWDGGVYC